MTYAGSPFPGQGGPQTLVVGDMETWVRQGRDMPKVDGYQFIDISELTPAFLRDLAPEIVLSALVGTKFDAVDVARRLGQMDFTGSYRVLTQNVPDLDLIIADVRNAAPMLDVDIINLADIFPDA